MARSNFVKFEDNLYIVAGRLNNPIQEEITRYKDKCEFDIALRRNDSVYFGYKIEEPEIISEFIDNKNTIHDAVTIFLSGVVDKKIEEVDNYMGELNSSEKLKYDESLLRSTLTNELLKGKDEK